MILAKNKLKSNPQFLWLFVWEINTAIYITFSNFNPCHFTRSFRVYESFVHRIPFDEYWCMLVHCTFHKRSVLAWRSFKQWTHCMSVKRTWEFFWYLLLRNLSSMDSDWHKYLSRFSKWSQQKYLRSVSYPT